MIQIGVVKGGTLSDITRYVTVSIPKAIAAKIDSLIEELGYWPSRSSFVREACLEKISVEERRLRGLRGSWGEANQPVRGEMPRRGTNPGDQPPLNGSEEAGPDSSPNRKGG